MHDVRRLVSLWRLGISIDSPIAVVFVVAHVLIFAHLRYLARGSFSYQDASPRAVQLLLGARIRRVDQQVEGQAAADTLRCAVFEISQASDMVPTVHHSTWVLRGHVAEVEVRFNAGIIPGRQPSA